VSDDPTQWPKNTHGHFPLFFLTMAASHLLSTLIQKTMARSSGKTVNADGDAKRPLSDDEKRQIQQFAVDHCGQDKTVEDLARAIPSLRECKKVAVSSVFTWANRHLASGQTPILLSAQAAGKRQATEAAKVPQDLPARPQKKGRNGSTLSSAADVSPSSPIASSSTMALATIGGIDL